MTGDTITRWPAPMDSWGPGTERRQLRGNERPQRRVLLTFRERLLLLSLALVALAAAIGWLA